MVLGELAFEAKRFLEAANHLGLIAERAGSLDKKDAVRILVHFVDALSQTGIDGAGTRADGHAGAHRPGRRRSHRSRGGGDLRARLPDSRRRALQRSARTLRQAAEGQGPRAQSVSLRRVAAPRARSRRALAPLEEAAELDPALRPPSRRCRSTGRPRKTGRRSSRSRTATSIWQPGKIASQILLDMGDIAAARLNDRTRAAKSYVAALEDKPDDRRLLTKLMQLYSEEKDWESSSTSCFAWRTSSKSRSSA